MTKTRHQRSNVVAIIRSEFLVAINGVLLQKKIHGSLFNKTNHGQETKLKKDHHLRTKRQFFDEGFEKGGGRHTCGA